MYLAMMVLLGLWQYVFLGNWPFQNMSQLARGIMQAIVNIVLVWFVIYILFYCVLGLGFNFLSYHGMVAVGKPGKTGSGGSCLFRIDRFLWLSYFYNIFRQMADSVVRFEATWSGFCGNWMGKRRDINFLYGPDCSFLRIDLEDPCACNPLVERHSRYAARARSVWLVGMGNHRTVRNSQRLACETVERHEYLPACQGHNFHGSIFLRCIHISAYMHQDSACLDIS